MNAEANYKVSFGRLARTLVFEDKAGILRFTFDFGPIEEPSGKRRNLVLDKRALIDVGGKPVLYNGDSEVERKRVAAALERVRQYASSCGYTVLTE